MTIDLSLFFPPNIFSSLSLSTSSPLLMGHGCVIYGARRSGKSSFAFQSIINTVQNSGRVIVFCQEHLLYSKMPQPFTSLSSLDEARLNCIEFAYIDCLSNVIIEIGEWSSPQQAPTLILIDDDGCKDAGDIRKISELLSALENLYDWLSQCGQEFHYIFVTNNITEQSQSCELPLVLFPIVNIFFTSAGSVFIQPIESDKSEIKSFRVEWDNGLVLQTSRLLCNVYNNNS